MARPEKERPQTLDEAVAQLKRDPSHPVRARVDNLDVELRALATAEAGKPRKLGSRMAALGPWRGESPDEILRFLREARAAGGSAEPPKV